jgi:hypothetical protein
MVLSWHSPGGTEENHAKPQSEYPVSRPRFEPGISRIQGRNAYHSAVTFHDTEHVILILIFGTLSCCDSKLVLRQWIISTCIWTPFFGGGDHLSLRPQPLQRNTRTHKHVQISVSETWLEPDIPAYSQSRTHASLSPMKFKTTSHSEI